MGVDTVLSILVLAVIALLLGAFALWRRTGQVKQPALMVLKHGEKYQLTADDPERAELHARAEELRKRYAGPSRSRAAAASCASTTRATSSSTAPSSNGWTPRTCACASSTAGARSNAANWRG